MNHVTRTLLGCTLTVLNAMRKYNVKNFVFSSSATSGSRSSADYDRVLEEIRRDGAVGAATRLMLAKKVFSHTARYDGMIANYLTSLSPEGERTLFPDVFTRQWEKVQDMRYGENPHQNAAFYRERTVAPGLLAGYTQLQGKELSYNNIADSDAAWECVRSFDTPACVIIKHANPCGVAIAGDVTEAYNKAFLTDSKSAFGGIIAFNREVTGECAERVSHQFAEVIIAPAFSKEALETHSPWMSHPGQCGSRIHGRN